MTGDSGTLLDAQARKLFTGIPGLTLALDIGPGKGKYGRYLREAAPGATINAMEIEAEYIERFDLRRVYDHVRIAPAVRLTDEPNALWDVVVLGDVLEHMPKSHGLDLLHFLVYRARYLWVQWPMRYLQGPMDGFRHEAHVSVWTEADIIGLNADYVKFEIAPLEGYAINGYPNAGRRVEEIMEVFNAPNTTKT